MVKWSGKTPNKIPELEINFSNLCTASCLICSRPHGSHNKPLMEPHVFIELLTQLKDVDFKLVQTSGNGESMLNPNYLDYVAALKGVFPDRPRWTFNNFSQINKERADRIVNEKLFDKVHVRIDSLVPWVFEKNSNLSHKTVFENLKYFLSINTDIPVTILYNHVPSYYDLCKKAIGKRPIRDYFTDGELSRVRYEEKEILEYFRPFSRGPISLCVIGHSLWGERMQAPHDTHTACPKINIINAAIWVCPDGQTMACCYSDRQNEMPCGNIMEDHILDIFYGEKRAEWIRKIKAREITDWPCVSPRCCAFGGEGVEKKI
jgi:hypothetical protein